jgi:hypothetical protein
VAPVALHDEPHHVRRQPWWLKYRLLRSDSLESGAVRLYDNLVVPLGKIIEGVLPPPLGKNVLLIAEK